MQIVGLILDFIVEIGRALLVEAVLGWIGRVQIGPKGMTEVRRRVHHATRKRLIKKLSTAETQ